MTKKRMIGIWMLLIASLTTASMAKETGDFANSPIKTIYVAAASHWNLGDNSAEAGGMLPYHFSVAPEVVKLDIKAHVDKVLDACIDHDDFYWTIEAFWMFTAWWDNTPDAARREKMVGFIRDGRIELSAPSHQYRSAFLGGEEVNRVCYEAERWRRDYKLPIDTALMNDVPGWNWSLVQPLAKSGVRYFFAGPNPLIGGILTLPPRDIPFWWQGPDGSRILTWVCAGSYTEGQTRVFINPSKGRFFTSIGVSMPGVSLGIGDAERKKIESMNDQDLMEYSIGQEMERLRKAKYPYDAILIQYAHDSVGPDSILGTMKYIREWNARHKYPQIVLSTPTRFFAHMEETYGASAFPVYSGDWAGLWETINFPQPNLTAQLRYTRNHAPALEKFSSIAELVGSRPYPWSELRRISSTVLEDDDQGGNGFAAPLLAYQSTKNLYQATLSMLVNDVTTSAPAVVVFNPASAKRTDVVESAFLKELGDNKMGLFDSVSGRAVAWERLSERSMRFVAADVPPLGYKVFLCAAKTSETANTESVASHPDTKTIENEFYRVSVDPKTGDVSSIFDKEAHREIVDHATTFGLNSLYDTSLALWGAASKHLPNSVKTTQTIAGATARLIIEREGIPLAHTEISLSAGVKRVDLSNRFVVTPGEHLARGYVISFPFALEKSLLVPRIENANAFLTPGGKGVEATYLPGAYKGAFVTTRAMELRDGDAYGIALAQRQSCAVYFDDRSSTVFSKIFTPEGNTNIADLEFPRELQFDYAITSYAGAFDPVRVKDFSEAYVLPLWGGWRLESGKPGDIFRAPGGPLKESQLSFLEISAPNVKLSAWKRVETGEAGEYLLRFQEIAGIAKTDVMVKSKFKLRKAQFTDMVEQPLKKQKAIPVNPLAFSIGANETVSVRAQFLRMADGHR